VQLRNSKTKYILVSPSKDDSESRHILDIAYGLLKLEAIGVSQSDIDLVIDGNNTGEIQTILAGATSNTYPIHKSNKLLNLITNVDKYENLVVVITGHGSQLGIVGKTTIQAEPFFGVVRSLNNIKNAVIVFGQCYAGVFNFTDARARRDKNNNQTSPNIIVLGATNLYESLSFSLSGTFLNNSIKTWLGNAFLICIFDWIANPVDIDGDGRFTITDAFKYAAALANGGNKRIKATSFMKALGAYEQLKQVNRSLQKDPHNQNLILTKQTLVKMVDDELNLRFVHQESWLLNAIEARKLEY
jgi:hypothetical protein